MKRDEKNVLSVPYKSEMCDYTVKSHSKLLQKREFKEHYIMYSFQGKAKKKVALLLPENQQVCFLF